MGHTCKMPEVEGYPNRLDILRFGNGQSPIIAADMHQHKKPRLPLTLSLPFPANGALLGEFLRPGKYLLVFPVFSPGNFDYKKPFL